MPAHPAPTSCRPAARPTIIVVRAPLILLCHSSLPLSSIHLAFLVAHVPMALTISSLSTKHASIDPSIQPSMCLLSITSRLTLRHTAYYGTVWTLEFSCHLVVSRDSLAPGEPWSLPASRICRGWIIIDFFENYTSDVNLGCDSQ
ncbi:hypothetical protein EJB05_36759, partial [Eragrostis curvula]